MAWDKGVQTKVFAAGAVTAFFVHWPAGWLIDHVGAKAVMGGGALLMAVASCLVPVLAVESFWYVVAYKALITLPYAPLIGLAFNVASQWGGAAEVGTTFALALNGFQLGPFALLLLAGVECETIGWPWVRDQRALEYISH